MKLKLDENGHVVVQDGKPVYVYDDGKEVPFDAVQATGKITQLNGEAKSHRERAEKAEELVKGFEGLDAAAARKAIDTVKNLDDKKLVDAGDVERLKSEWSKARDDDNAKSKAEYEVLQRQYHEEVIGGSFARSNLFAEKTILPNDIAKSVFGDKFSVKDGKLVAVDFHGNVIHSRTNIGEPATFNEAIETLIDQYPNKASILKPAGSGGGGASGSGAAGTPAKGNFGGTKEERQAAIQSKFNLPA